MIEFMVGLLVVVLLVSGLIQLVHIYVAHSIMLGEVRGAAGERAMNSATISGTPDYITDWNSGVDEIRHTADDQPESGSAAAFQSAIAERSANSPEQWALLDNAFNNGLLRFRGSLAATAHFGLVSEEQEQDIPLSDGIIRNWVYPKGEITLSTEVWMPRTGGIY